VIAGEDAAAVRAAATTSTAALISGSYSIRCLLSNVLSRMTKKDVEWRKALRRNLVVGDVIGEKRNLGST
jgi:hypothetical protein